MTHLTPRDAEDSYKTGLDYKGDNGSQIPDRILQVTKKEKSRLRGHEDVILSWYKAHHPKWKQGKTLEGFPQRDD